MNGRQFALTLHQTEVGWNSMTNNLMRLVNLDNDDEIVNVGILYVNDDNQYMHETDWE